MQPTRPHRRVLPLLRVAAVLALAAALLGGGLPGRPDGGAGAMGRGYLAYLVLARQPDARGAQRAAAAARDAGGIVGHRYPQIGVALAFSVDRGFARRVRRDPAIASVGATHTVRSRTVPVLDDSSAAGDRAAATSGGGTAARPPRSGAARPARPPGGVPVPIGAPLPGTAAARTAGAGPPPGPVPFPLPGPLGAAPGGSGERQERAAAAARRAPDPDAGGAADPHEKGEWFRTRLGVDRPGVRPTPAQARRTVVAVLDSGVDDTHPDLAAAVDPARSASCADGAPDSAFGAWRPLSTYEDSGHGTHVAGIVAAAKDGDGVAGVAPGTRIAAVRLLGRTGQYYAENMVCGFLWAADHGARVINDSYFSDPWKYNCPGDPDQEAITRAVRRAVGYAQRRGAVVVASAGNDGIDLAGPRDDDRSPNDHAADDQPPTRHLGPSCIRLPGQLPGVLRATALDVHGQAAAYTNYDAGPGTIAAPGGDPNGPEREQIVSAWPGGGFRALSGTSMSAGVVSGAAALLAARHPHWPSARVRAALLRGAAPWCRGSAEAEDAREAVECRAALTAYGPVARAVR